jgi:hypothetical protein
MEIAILGQPDISLGVTNASLHGNLAAEKIMMIAIIGRQDFSFDMTFADANVSLH